MYIGADLVPTDINKTLFENGNGEAFVGKELYEILKQSVKCFQFRGSSY